MSDFHQPCPDDIKWLKKILSEAQPSSCDYTVGNLLGWNEYYGEEISEIEGCLVVRVKENNLFGFPKGTNYKKALDYLKNNFDAPSFYGLTAEECEILKREYPDEYNYIPSRNSFDYVYRVSELAELKGKKYHSKKNHISYFEKNFDWSYEELNSELLKECISMDEKWYEQNVDKDPFGIEIENNLLKIALDNFDELEFKGGVLKADGKIVAFTFGEKLNDSTFCTHFEKALTSVRGAYPMINMLFAKNTISNFEFVNREDDVGSEGLRKAKLSYHPEFLVEKYTAVKL